MIGLRFTATIRRRPSAPRQTDAGPA